MGFTLDEVRFHQASKTRDSCEVSGKLITAADKRWPQTSTWNFRLNGYAACPASVGMVIRNGVGVGIELFYLYLNIHVALYVTGTYVSSIGTAKRTSDLMLQSGRR